jgi:hypothetical protein
MTEPKLLPSEHGAGATFCEGSIREAIVASLAEEFFQPGHTALLSQWYDSMVGSYRSGGDVELGSVDVRDVLLEGFLLGKSRVWNLGIDLPIWFGDLRVEKQRLMIVAMDPKRNSQEDQRITLNSVFSLHTRSGRETRRNDYWRFIEPFIKSGFVYLTDLYKLYYETSLVRAGVTLPLVSNKDETFIGRGTVAYQMNKSILAAEIKAVAPTRVVAFGNEAAAALRGIQGLPSPGPIQIHEGVEYVFVPHISRTVTQSISTIANLYATVGMLRGNMELQRIGQAMLANREAIYGTRSDT